VVINGGDADDDDDDDDDGGGGNLKLTDARKHCAMLRPFQCEPNRIRWCMLCVSANNI